MPKINHIPVPENLIPLTYDNAAEFYRWPADNPAAEKPDYPFCVGGDPAKGTNDFMDLVVDPDEVIIETQPKVRFEDSGLSDKAIEDFADVLESELQLQPILVRIFKTPSTYVNGVDDTMGIDPGQIQIHLIAGARRVLAARLIKQRQAKEAATALAAGKPAEEIPVVEFNLKAMMRVIQTEAVAEQLTRSENVNRENMSALEKFALYKPHLEAARNPKTGNVNVKAAADSAGISRTQMADYDRIDSIYNKAGEEEFTAMFNTGSFNFDVAAQLAKDEKPVRDAKLAAAKALINEKVMAKATKKAQEATQAILANPVVATMPAAQVQATVQAAQAQAVEQVKQEAATPQPGKAGVGTVTAAELNTAITKNKKKTAADIIKLFQQEISPALYSTQVCAWSAMFINWLEGNFGPEMDGQIIRGLANLFHPGHIVPPDGKAATAPAVIKPVVPAPKPGAAVRPVAPPPAPAAAPVGVPVAPAAPKPPSRPKVTVQ